MYVQILRIPKQIFTAQWQYFYLFWFWQIFDFTLSDQEMDQLNQLDRNARSFMFDSNFLPG